jgi:hypothetical protein
VKELCSCIQRGAPPFRYTPPILVDWRARPDPTITYRDPQPNPWMSSISVIYASRGATSLPQTATRGAKTEILARMELNHGSGTYPGR